MKTSAQSAAQSTQPEKYKDLSPISANLVAFPANVTKIGNALHRPFRRKIFQYVPSTARRNE
jgi:hypothetical protein